MNEIEEIIEELPVPVAPVKSRFEVTVENLREKIKECEDQIEWMMEHRTLIDAAPVEPSFYCSKIDFDNLTHDQVIKVVKLFPGKWDKTLSGQAERIDYETTFDGRQIRCWAGEPPPSCKIVEVDEIVPAQPETVRKVRKMVCKEIET